ncbi:MYCBP-associated protein [Protobothrops mucrosquamatus]|uniref:MYCBP-associated protein n=1 Tax=Protobothrops mucrosquamatus TaxID=103944 RepID=UPI000775B55C|nr:MYCBP-associated protein [Protobothrops mucrosquamatus]
MNKMGKKESRNSKTPPEKKRIKPFEQPSSPVQEEPEPVSCVLQGDEIQALAIKPEDLAKLRAGKRPQEKKEEPVVIKKYLVRKSRPQEIGKKANFLVAYPALPDESEKTLNYSGVEGPVVDTFGYITPYSILGTLQEFKKEAIKKGHGQIVRMIPEESHLSCAISVFGTYRKKPEEEKKVAQGPPSEHRALQNWQRNMALRRKQQKMLCECLQKSENQLLMNFSEHYRRIQEQRTLIDRSIPAMYSGKGYSGNEFWNQPVHVGDELKGLTTTLGQTDLGFPEEITHVGKPRSIWREMGTSPPKYLPFHRPWEKSLFLQHRRNELKEVLETLDFYSPDLDGLEVIGRNQPFTNVSADSFSACDDDNKESSEETTSDLLDEFPDIFSEPIFGPSLKFCGQPARWITTSHAGEVGIAARVTFEILVGDKAESRLTVSNDGTTAIWYDWQRLPPPFTFQEKTKRGIQNFYFNTRSGVILPGETIHFSFIFKSLSAGIFNESWEFSTHPELLGGAMLQVTLWGIALYEDTTVKLREDLEKDLEAREIALIVEENLEDLLNRIRTPARVRSPVDAYVTEEELFHRKNPELHYNHQVVKGLHELWNTVMNPQPVEVNVEEGQRKSTVSESSPSKSTADSQKSPEDMHKSISSPASVTKRLGLEELVDEQSRTEIEEVAQVEEAPHVEWNLSVADFRQTLLTVPEEEEREAALAQLNKAAMELCTAPLTTQEDLLYQICFQLWREVIDGLVNCSLVLRSLLGMPEKDTYVETAPEELADVKSAVAKAVKEDRKVQKEDKKTALKEKEKGKAVKEQERPNSRKGKGKEEKKVKTFTKETKDALSFSLESSEAELQLRREQIDPIVQEKYREKLYVEVYGLLNSMVNKMLFLFETVKKNALEKTKASFV